MEEWKEGIEEEWVAMEEAMEDTVAAGITDMVPVGFPMPGSLRTGIHPIRLLMRKSHPPLRSAQRTSTAPIVAVHF